MRKAERRKHTREPFDGSIQLHWQDDRRVDCYGQGKCVEVSDSGLRVEVAHSIGPRTAVQLRLERYDFTGSAIVRHCVWRGSKYHLGLEFRNLEGRKLRDLARLLGRSGGNRKPPELGIPPSGGIKFP